MGSILATVGGVVTAVVAIAGFNSLSEHLYLTYALQKPQISPSPTPTPLKEVEVIAKLDASSMLSSEQPIDISNFTIAKTPYIAPGVGKLSPEEIEIARQAWSYFPRNWHDQTGLVNSVDGFTSVTMSDQAAAIAALVSAKELNIIPAQEFQTKMSRMLKTLASIRLYKGELPNKVYNPKTLLPVNYGQLDKREEIGWSALDLGRLAIWLKIVGAKYPQLRSQTEAVILESLLYKQIGKPLTVWSGVGGE
ncbi:MAG: DUF3131 domain-containing protein [Gloeotrichia echinulata IR180]